MAPHPLAVPLRTERFLLQPLGRLAAYRWSYPASQDPAIMLGYSGSAVRRTRWRWFREMIRPDGRSKFVYGIVDAASQQRVGIHSVILRPHRTAVLGVVLPDRSWWGSAVVEEVRSRLIDHILEHQVADRFIGQVQARNFPSVFNYRKLGFAHVGTFHRMRWDPVSGSANDVLVFELLSENWRGRDGGG